MTIDISIVLPNLNHLRFLPDRVKTITAQTFENWECIVIDGYSDDGSWEYLNKRIGLDTRFRLYQESPKGAYNAWNKGISIAKGKYIYIATSDDTMEPTCLEKMYNALEHYTQCHVAHCCLTIIDEKGMYHQKQWNKWEKIKFLGKLIEKKHIRYSPYDVFLHGGWSTVYSSVTQLLIKRKLFDQIGLFREDLGSTADFEWGLRVAFVANILHIPEYLATWRLHDDQLSTHEFFQSHEFSSQLCNMVNMAYRDIGHLSPKVSDKQIYDLVYIYRRQALIRAFNRLSLYEYAELFLSTVISHKKAVRDFLFNILSFNAVKKIDATHYIQRLIDKYDLDGNWVEILE